MSLEAMLTGRAMERYAIINPVYAKQLAVFAAVFTACLTTL